MIPGGKRHFCIPYSVKKETAEVGDRKEIRV